MLKSKDGGFTLIEITIAILILSVAVLGIASSAGQMIAPVGDAELEFNALQSVEDRLANIQLDPRYPLLDSLYSAEEGGLPGLEGLTRETKVTRYRIPQQGGKIFDYTEIVVTVSGPGLENPVYRKLVVGAP